MREEVIDPVRKEVVMTEKVVLRKKSLCQAEEVIMRAKIILLGMVHHTYSVCNTDPFLV